jgi:hypothetical protein
MKNYMFIYEGGDPQWHTNTKPEDMQAQMEKWEQWMQMLSEKGQLVSGGDPLDYGGKRVNADGVVTDISTAEFKDLVSGYSVISAKDINEAVEISQTCPIFFDPSVRVQVREVLEFG